MGKMWLGAGQSAVEDAVYENGKVYLGSAIKGGFMADAVCISGYVYRGGSQSAQAVAYYEGDSDGAAAAAFLLLL